MKKKYFLVFLLLIVFLITGCHSKTVAGETVTLPNGSYQNITADNLNTLLKNKDFTFVNVHIPFAGNIAGTDLSIPYDQIEQDLSQLPSEKSAKIVLYCRGGHMSAIAAEKLVSLGYTNIWNLKGGMADWEKAGYQIEK
jgi:Rhodanese-related sulfurtransferase